MNRLSAAVDEVLRKEQAGYRQGRYSREPILTLRNVIEHFRMHIIEHYRTANREGLISVLLISRRRSTAYIGIVCGAYCSYIVFSTLPCYS